MLRITVHDNPATTTFQLEGTLVGPWVQEATECWRRAGSSRQGQRVRFDLVGLTSIDAAGKAFLSAMVAEGAEFVACGCLMRSIVADITGDSTPGCGPTREQIQPCDPSPVARVGEGAEGTRETGGAT